MQRAATSKQIGDLSLQDSSVRLPPIQRDEGVLSFAIPWLELPAAMAALSDLRAARDIPSILVAWSNCPTLWSWLTQIEPRLLEMPKPDGVQCSHQRLAENLGRFETSTAQSRPFFYIVEPGDQLHTLAARPKPSTKATVARIWEDTSASFLERCEASQLILISDAIKPRYSSSSGRNRFRGVRWPAELCRQIRELSNAESNQDAGVALVRRARLESIQAEVAEHAAGSDFSDIPSQVDPSIFNAVLDAANRVVETFSLGVQFDVQLECAKLDAMKQLAYGASHEVNNPLANISTRAQTLLRDETSPDRRQKLAAIVSQAFRAHDMISNMMLYGHPPEHSASAFAIREWFKQLVPVLAPLWTAESPALVLKLNEWQLELDGSEVSDSAFDPLPSERLLWGDPEQLSILVQCLARNAFEALGSEGKVAVSISVPPAVASDSEAARWPAGDGWEIVVSDDGPGMSPEIRRHCFDPFYSGREAGRGLGFGLSKAWAICRLHEGHICITPGDPKGISVRCWFPGQSASPASNDETCSMHKASSCKTIPTAG